MISVELKHLLHLLNDMQEQSCYVTEVATDFDVVLLICELVASLRHQLAKTTSIEIKAAHSFILHLPENALRQALLNLFLNAAEAVSGCLTGHICIKVYKSESGLTIQVLDSGSGFSQTMLVDPQPVFGNNPQRGIGSGLAMVQRFVKNSGGNLKLSNRHPHGACVTLVLPTECMRN